MRSRWAAPIALSGSQLLPGADLTNPDSGDLALLDDNAVIVVEVERWPCNGGANQEWSWSYL